MKFKGVRKKKEQEKKSKGKIGERKVKLASIKKGEIKAKYFPKIKRIIPERKKKICSVPWVLSTTIICLLAFGVVCLLLFLRVQQIQDLRRQRTVLEANLHKWQTVIRRYPDYRDGYLQAAVVEYRLNNLLSARKYAEQALAIDQTSDYAKKLLQILERSAQF